MDMRPYGFIYVTENSTNGKRYIGQCRYSKGWENYLGSGKLLKRAISKYGRGSFKRTIIFVAFDKEILNETEIALISEFHAVKSPDFYNLSSGGHGSTRGFLGKKHSPETREKMRKAQLGHPVSDKTKTAVGAAHRGIKRTEESRRKQSKAISGANHHRAKEATIDGVTYPTITAAAKALDLSYPTVWRMVHNQ